MSCSDRRLFAQTDSRQTAQRDWQIMQVVSIDDLHD